MWVQGPISFSCRGVPLLWLVKWPLNFFFEENCFLIINASEQSDSDTFVKVEMIQDNSGWS